MSSEPSDDAQEDDDGNVENTYLTFQVDGEEYAVPVTFVTEIVRLQKTFMIPDVPGYVRGVINLRGRVITLLDVRHRFGLEDTKFTDRTVVVVLEVADTAVGLIVDAVTEVAEILPEQIEPRARLGESGSAAMVKGMGKRDENVSFILDVNALLDIEQADALRAASPVVVS